jgi:hypothetical protein
MKATNHFFSRRFEDNNANYFQALGVCNCECIRRKDGYYITNDVWDRNQTKLMESRQSYTNEEKDKTMKQNLYSKLSEATFKSQGSHVNLTFQLNFEINETGISKLVTLCESCYVIFNNHICKYLYIYLFSS